jgi:hypothetical protein
MRRNRNGSVTSPVSSPVTQALSSTPASTPLTGFRGYSGASAGYSLRKIGSGPVVRLRRASDNAEKDFYAGDLIGSSEGSELVTDPDFATGSSWIVGTGWSVTGGQAISDGSNGSIQLSGGIPTTDIVIATINIVACSSFTDCLIRVGANTGYSLASLGITATGTYQVVSDPQNSALIFTTTNGATVTLESFSCKTYTPTAAELWTVEGNGDTTVNFSYATTWYDQSGSGNDATQSTAAAQPLLIRAGVTNTVGGKAALDFDGTDDYLETQSFNSSQPISFFTVQRFDAAGNGANTYLFATNGNDVFITANFADRYQISAGANCRADVSLYSNDQELFSVVFNSVNSNLYINGLDGQLDSNDAGVNGLTAPIRIGGSDAAPANGMLGEIQEFIIYASDQSANRPGIETNINDYWSIY